MKCYFQLKIEIPKIIIIKNGLVERIAIEKKLEYISCICYTYSSTHFLSVKQPLCHIPRRQRNPDYISQYYLNKYLKLE